MRALEWQRVKLLRSSELHAATLFIGWGEPAPAARPSAELAGSGSLGGGAFSLLLNGGGAGGGGGGMAEAAAARCGHELIFAPSRNTARLYRALERHVVKNTPEVVAGHRTSKARSRLGGGGSAVFGAAASGQLGSSCGRHIWLGVALSTQEEHPRCGSAARHTH